MNMWERQILIHSNKWEYVVKVTSLYVNHIVKKSLYGNIILFVAGWCNIVNMSISPVSSYEMVSYQEGLKQYYLEGIINEMPGLTVNPAKSNKTSTAPGHT